MSYLKIITSFNSWEELIMKILKKLLLVIVAVVVTLVFMNLVLDAWDNTMTDEEIVYYLEQYPNEEKLIKLAERRNIVVDWD